MTAEWVDVPACDLYRHIGRIVSIYRSRIPTRIVDVSDPDAAGVRRMTIEWGGPTSTIGGLVRHDAGRRQVELVADGDEYPVQVGEGEQP